MLTGALFSLVTPPVTENVTGQFRAVLDDCTTNRAGREILCLGGCRMNVAYVLKLAAVLLVTAIVVIVCIMLIGG